MVWRWYVPFDRLRVPSEKQMRGFFAPLRMTICLGGRWALREDVHGGGVGAYGCGVDPGFGLLDGVVVDEVAGFEVVGRVEN